MQFNYTMPIRLESHNFLVWKAQFLLAIRGNHLLGFIDGSLPCPSLVADDPESIQDVEYWLSQDEFIKQLMYTSISEEVMNQLVGCNTSFESWKALEDLYASPSKSRILQLQIQLHNAKKADSTMTEFFSKVKKIADQLGAAGQSISEKVQIRVLLAGVGNEYDSIVSSITAMSASFSLCDVQALLLN